MLAYFRLLDMDFPRRWRLNLPRDSSGEECNPWPFLEGKPLPVMSDLVISIKRQGTPLDFTFGPFDVPFVTPEVAELIQETAGEDVQLIPARLETGKPMRILVVTRLEDCFDHMRSEVAYRTDEHAKALGKPWTSGHPHTVYKLLIDPAKTENRHVLRIKTWIGPLIVSEDVKNVLERRGITGVSYLPVTS